MALTDKAGTCEAQVPVINLAEAPGEGQAWDRPKLVVYMWAVVEQILVTNPWQVSSKLRVKALRCFGANIGNGVVFRPRTRVKFPWKLQIGDRSWIGEGVWIHNQDRVTIGNDAVISQDVFITTGSHRHRIDMGLITAPIIIDDGAWVTARCVVLGGTQLGKSSLITPNSVVGPQVDVELNTIYGGNPAVIIGQRMEFQ